MLTTPAPRDRPPDLTTDRSSLLIYNGGVVVSFQPSINRRQWPDQVRVFSKRLLSRWYVRYRTSAFYWHVSHIRFNFASDRGSVLRDMYGIVHAMPPQH